MAAISRIVKNEYRIRKANQLFQKREELRRQRNNKNNTMEQTFEFQNKLNHLPRDSSKIRIRNRCNLTGKPRGFVGKFHLCRNKVRELAAAGLLGGLIKSSW